MDFPEASAVSDKLCSMVGERATNAKPSDIALAHGRAPSYSHLQLPQPQERDVSSSTVFRGSHCGNGSVRNILFPFATLLAAGDALRRPRTLCPFIVFLID
jgi:hypothetical protein